MKHELKILDNYFDAVDSNIKPFEVRKNDRDFHVGDLLLLREVVLRNITDKNDEQEPSTYTEYTGRTCEKYITYILPLEDINLGFGGYVVLGLKDRTYRL